MLYEAADGLLSFWTQGVLGTLPQVALRRRASRTVQKLFPIRSSIIKLYRLSDTRISSSISLRPGNIRILFSSTKGHFSLFERSTLLSQGGGPARAVASPREPQRVSSSARPLQQASAAPAATLVAFCFHSLRTIATGRSVRAPVAQTCVSCVVGPVFFKKRAVLTRKDSPGLR